MAGDASESARPIRVTPLVPTIEIFPMEPAVAKPTPWPATVAATEAVAID